ncbi:RNA-binding KH domain-containing RCF3-like [Olea europaea subsp. europaea]|uniref:RNA-binding KH domain-containing RCF3-like n=1 Tax=Olea europaea subsp. europaea TaxID=158383 RepID=A0A8S0PCP4_OLEEU|nr:RNA-binding KH domain-containing RCF3-like [Olea europaea subsp. europaea]
MERSRSKRYYYDQDYDSENLHSRTKQRYSGSHSGGGGGGVGGGQHFVSGNHRRSVGGGGSGGGGGGGGGRKVQDLSLMVTTSYRILCHDLKAGGVIGKSGSIIKAIRQHTGAWINVHELIPGDEERIIEISDTRRRDPDGRMPAFSPAQEALYLIHERILENDVGGFKHNVGFGDDPIDEYGPRGSGGGTGNNGNRVVTRLVVSRMHVGSLLGKGGKIIEQMRIETKTQIRILPRDHTLPRCVAMSEEIVQVVGDMNAVKNAVAIISSRLRESQHRDRSHFHNRLHSPERFFPPDDNFIPINTASRKSSVEGPNYGSRIPAGSRSNNYSSHPSGYLTESVPEFVGDNTQAFSGEDLVFRILCPADKVDSVFGESNAFMELLQEEIGVDVKVADPVAGVDEHIIIISSEEGPDDELFPAQEALLHIQTRIVDLVPEKENIITTRLLLQSDELGCLGLKDGMLPEMRKITGANIHILPREEQPAFVSETDEILQIVGEIKAAREALVEITSKLRSYIYREFLELDAPTPISASNTAEVEHKAISSNSITQSQEIHSGNSPTKSTHQGTPTVVTEQQAKDVGPSGSESVKQNGSERREDIPNILNRLSVPLVTRSTLEIVITPNVASKLVAKSRNKLTLISELSGANVKLMEDRPEVTEKIIQISGTPEQAERAQSLLQGFILSTEEDGP